MTLYLSCLSKLKDKMFNLNTKEAKNIEKENTFNQIIHTSMNAEGQELPFKTYAQNKLLFFF